MKIVSYKSGSGPRYGLVEGGLVREAGDSLADLQPRQTVAPLASLTLLPPILSPGKIVCVGKNYHRDDDTDGSPARVPPVLFSKLGSALVGPGRPILLHRITHEVTYEAELAVVIGRRARATTEADALDYVFGYTCLNDVSARDLQDTDGQWLRAKSLDTFCPMGPWIVTRDEIADPQKLGIRCRRNGQLVQDSNTSRMLFSVAELISYISEAITLEPGDVIATGTPVNVRAMEGVPRILEAGDLIQVDIDQIGALENPVEAG
jgi:2-keto-4-pentenoate hydratase/2-oxohepta-3-ene-1,7-dioic acid hydratase in catechol pathway